MKQQHLDNFRVEVDPDLGYFPHLRTKDEKELRRQCEEIAVSIRQHVDDIKSVHVLWDITDVCSFCNSVWEEDEEGPLCCKKAQDEWDEIRIRKGERA